MARLREVGGGPKPAVSTTQRRTFSVIVAAAEEVRRRREAREQQKAERARLAKLDALAKREEQVWSQAPGLPAQRTASGYEQAVSHLAEQRDLAVHRNQRAAFDARLTETPFPYVNPSALQRRLCEKKLVE